MVNIRRLGGRGHLSAMLARTIAPEIKRGVEQPFAKHRGWIDA
ncbi:hypothetical protein [Mesorhizobium sp.]|nr:hypothetical protein [Mesorhizobium sp.]